MNTGSRADGMDSMPSTTTTAWLQPCNVFTRLFWACPARSDPWPALSTAAASCGMSKCCKQSPQLGLRELITAALAALDALLSGQARITPPACSTARESQAVWVTSLLCVTDHKLDLNLSVHQMACSPCSCKCMMSPLCRSARTCCCTTWNVFVQRQALQLAACYETYDIDNTVNSLRIGESFVRVYCNVCGQMA